MNRKLATIQLISDLQPIAGADKIETATVLIKREGVVIRDISNSHNSFKVINPDFLLKYAEEDE